jgi:hypothetical protein
MLLHLRDLLDLQSSPTVLPLSLAHHVETVYGPSKAYCNANKSESFQVARSTNTFLRCSRTCNTLLVDHSGTAPESAAPSLRRNYNNIVIIRHTYLCVNQIRPTTTFRERGNYSTNKNTTTTTITPMAQL